MKKRSGKSARQCLSCYRVSPQLPARRCCSFAATFKAPESGEFTRRKTNIASLILYFFLILVVFLLPPNVFAQQKQNENLSLNELLDRARSEYGDLPGVTANVRSGHVELEGEVVEPEDFKKIENMARHDLRIRSHVRLTKDVVRELTSAIAEAIGIPGITVRPVRGRILLEGVAYSASDAKRAVEIAKLYAPDVLDLVDVRDSRKEVGRGKMIELSFHLVEIKKDALRQLGLNWAPGAMPAGGTSGGLSNSAQGLFSSIAGMGKELIGFVFNLIPKLNFIRESGNGRVLENPAVVVKSGEEAKIFSGLEVPYYKGSDVDFKKVGIQIEAVPVEISDGVDMKLSATLSTPAAEMRGAVSTNTIATSAICKFGQSLVLGNIIRNGDVKMKNRVPSGMDTSTALFTLFLSKDFQSSRSEFVVFVTPRLIESPPSADKDMAEYSALEEAITRDRSKKEYAQYLAGKDEATESDAKKTKRRKWR